MRQNQYYTLLKDESKLKETVAKFCKLANIEVNDFRTIYMIIDKYRKKSKQDKIEYAEYQKRLANGS